MDHARAPGRVFPVKTEDSGNTSVRDTRGCKQDGSRCVSGIFWWNRLTDWLLRIGCSLFLRFRGFGGDLWNVWEKSSIGCGCWLLMWVGVDLVLERVSGFWGMWGKFGLEGLGLIYRSFECGKLKMLLRWKCRKYLLFCVFLVWSYGVRNNWNDRFQIILKSLVARGKLRRLVC